MESQAIPTIRYTARWFCYLDLLGFRALVGRKDIQQVLPLYEQALVDLKKAVKTRETHGILHSWFSDTFIIYSKRGRAEDFSQIEQAGRFFFRELIAHGIPVRGALTYGKLYSQQERNIFIGPALIDGYQYGEGQDWLGFLLTPAAIGRMGELGLPASERLNYRIVEDVGVVNENLSGPVYAFCFGDGKVQGKNRYLASLEEMRSRAGPEYSAKYDRTISFLKANSYRKVVTGAPSA